MSTRLLLVVVDIERDVDDVDLHPLHLILSPLLSPLLSFLCNFFSLEHTK